MEVPSNIKYIQPRFLLKKTGADSYKTHCNPKEVIPKSYPSFVLPPFILWTSYNLSYRNIGAELLIHRSIGMSSLGLLWECIGFSVGNDSHFIKLDSSSLYSSFLENRPPKFFTVLTALILKLLKNEPSAPTVP